LTILTNGYETVAYGVDGWSAIISANWEKIDSSVGNVNANANNNLGDTVIAASAVTATDPLSQNSASLTNNTTGTPAGSLEDATATYSQSITNDNNASILDEINKLVAEMAQSRTRETEYKTAILALQTSYNNLLIALRTTTGCGILSG